MGKPYSSPDGMGWQSRPGHAPERDNQTKLSAKRGHPEDSWDQRPGDLLEINPDLCGSLEVRPEDILGL